MIAIISKDRVALVENLVESGTKAKVAKRAYFAGALSVVTGMMREIELSLEPAQVVKRHILIGKAEMKPIIVTSGPRVTPSREPVAARLRQKGPPAHAELGPPRPKNKVDVQDGAPQNKGRPQRPRVSGMPRGETEYRYGVSYRGHAIALQVGTVSNSDRYVWLTNAERLAVCHRNRYTAGVMTARNA